MQETFQALLALINNSATTNNQEDQASYIGIYEGDESLFFPADRQSRSKPISSTSILKKKNKAQDQDDSAGLGETEGVLIPDIDIVMEESGNNQGQVEQLELDHDKENNLEAEL